jgi:Rps23 Pro-64 3,4-dihydroxylase Tpa1-like proline 4-hydroxylase
MHVNGAAPPPPPRDEAGRGEESPQFFRLNPKLDAARLACKFKSAGRVQIADFLHSGGAERLFEHIRAREDWHLVLNDGDKLFELDRAAQAALSLEARSQLDIAVYQGARAGFQFRYETLRVPDAESARRAEATLLTAFASFMSSPEVLGFLKRVTGTQRSIAFADAQATAYGPHHFLTGHDDAVVGKSRVAAYVLSLTPQWKVEWGGLLIFHRQAGDVEEAYMPSFNTLNVFTVPQLHSVSYVSPFVPHRRYSVTGWLRGSG